MIACKLRPSVRAVRTVVSVSSPLKNIVLNESPISAQSFRCKHTILTNVPRRNPFWASQYLFSTNNTSSTENPTPQSEKPTERKFTKKRNAEKFPITWKTVAISGILTGLTLVYLWDLKRRKEEEREKQKRRTLGKSLIGGPWSLTNTQTGKVESEKDYLGKWLLIYFGFTHCPDICPDELEKMCTVVKKLDDSADETFQPVTPFFFTVDPERDTAEAVKKYCAEFSPRLIGFTGSKEDVKKVTRTFRVYHSEGPKDEYDDYIVDHTVIMYLIDPTGQFIDYYGQNRKPQEIVDAIQLQMLKFAKAQKKGWI